MDAAAGVAVVRGVSMPMSTTSQSSRKEWRVVTEQSARNSTSEELSKLGQSDERLIYEQGREPTDVDFCSITIDRGLDNDILQQRLLTVAKQREELQHMEIELRAQVIIRSEIMEMQKSYDAQIKEHVNANVKFQEQLHEKEQKIQELERKMEENERELNGIRLDKEAQAWAKEDLLREQSKELQSFRRERDSTEAERALHIRQIHDLQEHVQEKERQLMELQEQHRIAQETIVFKDEQLREAQAWITRAQEMDALQSTTNHTLQAELRERIEQYNQLWLVCQRQFGEMERFHLHMQQLQLELADAREKSGSYSQINSKDASEVGQSNGSLLEVNGNGTPGENSASLLNGNVEVASSFVPGGNMPTQTDAHAVPFAPPSLLGLPPYLPPVQVTALHPFVMHQQGLPRTIPSNVTQSIFQTVPTMSSLQPSQNQQTVSDGQQMPIHQQFPLQAEQTSSGAASSYDYEVSVNGQVLSSNYFDANISRGIEPNSMVPPPNKEGQVLESVDESYPAGTQSPQSLQQVSSQFHDLLRLDTLEHSNEIKEKNDSPVTDHRLENRSLMMEQPNFTVNVPLSEALIHAVNIGTTTMNNVSGAVSSDATVSTGQKNSYVIETPAEISLLDERSLLACIVRTIGSGGRIRISATLPNRLGKMLAPFHWHDYKKYGKLDDFVAGHTELFVIEGDYIQLREGAQEIIAATAAVAKVAAAAAAPPSSYPTLLPSVAVTPMAQAHRLKVSSLEFTSANADKTNFNEIAASRPSHIAGNPSKFSTIRNQNVNGASFSVSGAVSNIKILSKPKDHMELNGSENSELLTVGNGINTDKDGVSQRKVATHGKPGASLAGKQQGRATSAASSPRR
ncbi:uncharacterized protein LOC111396290 isoform X3 [Olea europaea var. sylvestris]|uniref:uncharacterized protein LOC111396290 isoform X3 n=1 Tax=Olea europaea var. sylvestris TaxID=158386 RepID=UPI000C1D652F|nr:uncharacterized protein LOC111396290 isoform X3 [Olea europaea var. sylvestris]